MALKMLIFVLILGPFTPRTVRSDNKIPNYNINVYGENNKFTQHSTGGGEERGDKTSIDTSTSKSQTQTAKNQEMSPLMPAPMNPTHYYDQRNANFHGGI
jgi:hypothetical protein